MIQVLGKVVMKLSENAEKENPPRTSPEKLCLTRCLNPPVQMSTCPSGGTAAQD
jgi:hypothetical protein